MIYKDLNKNIEDLVFLSHEIGNRLDYVQGGGGNISVKIDQKRLIVKASGVKLKNLNSQYGFSLVNFAQVNKLILQLIQDPKSNDDKFNHNINKFNEEIPSSTKLRPSMEIGFHSLISSKYVIHSHPIYCQLLLSCKEGEKITQQIFDDVLWVDYRNPGWDLTKHLSRELNKKNSSVIFLQNHGLIIADDNFQQALKLHEQINKKICDYLSIDFNKFDNNNLQTRYSSTQIEFFKNNILFPDQIIFGNDQDSSQNQIYQEILFVYFYILNNLKKSDLKPNFISQENVDFVKNMESEKYRKKINKDLNNENINDNINEFDKEIDKLCK
jgi:rhamnose utilization protein RhaD (predicted bifunctional aldolase and dehydrogenase)